MLVSRQYGGGGGFKATTMNTHCPGYGRRLRVPKLTTPLFLSMVTHESPFGPTGGNHCNLYT